MKRSETRKQIQKDQEKTKAYLEANERSEHSEAVGRHRERSEHTPTPWVLDGDFLRTKENIYERIASVNPSHKDAKTNLEFIVRAVNSHEALLAGITAALNCVVLSKDKPAHDVVSEMVEVLQATLQKTASQAEGRAGV